MLKTVKLSELKPNPYRHFGTYEIQEDKIDSLLESITASGFWGETVIARAAQEGYELAFGHHRWQAAMKFHEENRFDKDKIADAGISSDGEVQISVRPLDNDAMLQMMARENDEVYDANAQQDLELVKASLDGMVAGEIHIPPNEGDKQSQVFDYIIKDNTKPVSYCEFSPVELSKYLGRSPSKTERKNKKGEITSVQYEPHWRVKGALASLKLVKADITYVDDYEGMSPRQAVSLNQAVRKVKDEPKKLQRKVIEVAKATASLEGRGSGHRAIEAATKKVIDDSKKKEKQIPDINDVCIKLAKDVASILASGTKQDKILEEIIKYQESASAANIFRVQSVLKSLAFRATSLAKKLNAPDISLVKDEKRKTI